MPVDGKKKFLLAVSLLTFCSSGAQAINPTKKAPAPAPALSQTDLDMRNAWNLYQQHNFAASADAFENIMRSAPPSAKLFYYAVLANRASGRNLRAKQLSDFVVTNFATSQESAYCKQMFPSSIATASAANDAELPESVKNALPPEMQAMLQTAAGRAAVREAMAKDPKNFETVRSAEKQGLITKTTVAGARRAMTPSKPFAAKTRVGHPFTAEDIARDGAGGIDQTRFPNCWFEASMSALAELPRGQALMASMIRYGEPGAYVVRFPGDGKEYVVTEDFMNQNGIHDKALWASIIECAQIQKFPGNEGASGSNGDQSRLEVGLGCITGCRAEVILPANCSSQEISTFIGGAVSSKNPIVCGTMWSGALGGLPSLVVPQHAYTITGFDASKNMIVFRNPHGANAQRFRLSSDPNHLEFEQLSDGVFKMSIPLFQKYFHSMARSFI